MPYFCSKSGKFWVSCIDFKVLSFVDIGTILVGLMVFDLTHSSVPLVSLFRSRLPIFRQYSLYFWSITEPDSGFSSMGLLTYFIVPLMKFLYAVVFWLLSGDVLTNFSYLTSLLVDFCLPSLWHLQALSSFWHLRQILQDLGYMTRLDVLAILMGETLGFSLTAAPFSYS